MLRHRERSISHFGSRFARRDVEFWLDFEKSQLHAGHGLRRSLRENPKPEEHPVIIQTGDSEAIARWKCSESSKRSLCGQPGTNSSGFRALSPRISVPPLRETKSSGPQDDLQSIQAMAGNGIDFSCSCLLHNSRLAQTAWLCRAPRIGRQPLCTKWRE